MEPQQQSAVAVPIHVLRKSQAFLSTEVQNGAQCKTFFEKGPFSDLSGVQVMGV